MTLPSFSAIMGFANSILSRTMFPLYWSNFLNENKLVQKEASIPEEADFSEIGADLRFYNAEESKEEMEEYYPGLAVAPDGFIAVACCTTGSGNPYFINIHDGVEGPLYRIYHDEVIQGSYNRSEAVYTVLSSYRDVLKFVFKD